jgi:hypothetical protein
MARSGARARFTDSIRIKPDPSRAATTEKLRVCARAGCTEEGAYRVPKSRENLQEHLWFCLIHAREHNESWDYFKGMSERDIERFRTDALVGHRPTWPLGKRSARMHNPYGSFHFDDGFGKFSSEEKAKSPRRPERQVTRLQLQAFDALNLEPCATLNEIKARY